MVYTLRDYQQAASDAAVAFFNEEVQKTKKKNGLLILPTGGGKSLVIADIASKIDEPLIVLQPSQEILMQNYNKLRSYDVLDCSIYSASLNRKEISRITFATIGSVMSHLDDFDHFHKIIVDECFPGTTFVSTENGKCKIKTLYNWFVQGRELPRVLSYNEATKQCELKRIVRVMSNGVKPTMKVLLNRRQNLVATPNHPVLTTDGWKQVRELREGNAILTSSDGLCDTTVLACMNDDQKDLIYGSIIGDGSIDKRGANVYRFRFVQGEAQEDYLRWKASMLGCDNVKRVEENGFAKKPAYRFNSHTCYFNGNELSKKYAIEHLTPKSLAVLYLDDGHLGGTCNYMTICSVAESMELTELLAQKLREFGIECSASRAKSSLTEKPYNYIRINKNGTEVLSKLIAPYVVSSMAYKILPEHHHLVGTYNWNTKFTQNGVVVVQRVEQNEPCEVYNMEVEDNHTYVIANGRYDKLSTNPCNGMIVHNCHMVNPFKGQYKDFFEAVEGRKVVGLTATPYRLSQTVDPKTMNSKYPTYGSILKFLTRTRPRVFTDVLYYCQVGTLLSRGYLARLRYFDMNQIDLDNVRLNTTGADYDDRSLFKEFERVGLHSYTLDIVRRLLKPKNGIERNGILVFTKFVEDAERLAEDLGPVCEVVSGSTPKKEREEILENFKAGNIKVVANVGVLTTGFDFPALDTIVLARPTMSLALYYQMVGRAIRPYENKEGWIVDLCGSVTKFGKVENLEVKDTGNGKYIIHSNGKQLTNILLTK